MDTEQRETSNLPGRSRLFHRRRRTDSTASRVVITIDLDDEPTKALASVVRMVEQMAEDVKAGRRSFL